MCKYLHEKWWIKKLIIQIKPTFKHEIKNGTYKLKKKKKNAKWLMGDNETFTIVNKITKRHRAENFQS